MDRQRDIDGVELGPPSFAGLRGRDHWLFDLGFFRFRRARLRFDFLKIAQLFDLVVKPRFEILSPLLVLSRLGWIEFIQFSLMNLIEDFLAPIVEALSQRAQK